MAGAQQESIGEVAFAVAGGGSLTLDVERVTVGDANVTIGLLADPPAWARVDAGALLHLDPAARGQLLGGGFDGAVRIEAVLDATVMRDLGVPDAAAIAARLRDGDVDDPLSDERSWWALEATGELEVPAGMAGELRAGLRTIWHADPPPAGMATVIAAALDDIGVAPSVEPTDDGDWIVRFRDAGAIGLAVPRERNGQAIVYHILARLCPDDRLDELARLTALVNFDLPIGCLEAHLETGQARIRTSLDVTGDRLSLAAADNLVRAGRHLATTWLPAVARVIDGASADAALADA